MFDTAKSLNSCVHFDDQICEHAFKDLTNLKDHMMTTHGFTIVTSESSGSGVNTTMAGGGEFDTSHKSLHVSTTGGITLCAPQTSSGCGPATTGLDGLVFDDPTANILQQLQRQQLQLQQQDQHEAEQLQLQAGPPVSTGKLDVSKSRQTNKNFPCQVFDRLRISRH